MFTPMRFLAGTTGCAFGAGGFLLFHGRPLLGLTLIAGLVVGAVLLIVIGAQGKQNAHNRRAGVQFAEVLAQDAAHHAANAGSAAGSGQVTR